MRAETVYTKSLNQDCPERRKPLETRELQRLVKSADLGDPTMLFQMYHRSPIPIERKQTAEMIMKLSANPMILLTWLLLVWWLRVRRKMNQRRRWKSPAQDPLERLAGLLLARLRRRNAMSSGRPRFNVVFRSAFSRLLLSEVERPSERLLAMQSAHPHQVVTPTRFQRAVQWVLPRTRLRCPSPAKVQRQIFPSMMMVHPTFRGGKAKGKGRSEKGKGKPDKGKGKGDKGKGKQGNDRSQRGKGDRTRSPVGRRK